jgi:hypothetical protein
MQSECTSPHTPTVAPVDFDVMVTILLAMAGRSGAQNDVAVVSFLLPPSECGRLSRQRLALLRCPWSPVRCSRQRQRFSAFFLLPKSIFRKSSREYGRLLLDCSCHSPWDIASPIAMASWRALRKEAATAQHSRCCVVAKSGPVVHGIQSSVGPVLNVAQSSSSSLRPNLSTDLSACNPGWHRCMPGSTIFNRCTVFGSAGLSFFAVRLTLLVVLFSSDLLRLELATM